MNKSEGNSATGASVISLAERRAQRETSPVVRVDDDFAEVVSYEDVRLPKDVAAMYVRFKQDFPGLFHRGNRQLLSRIERTRRFLMEQVPSLGLGLVILQVADTMSKKLLDEVWDYLEERDQIQDIEICSYMSLRSPRKTNGRLWLNQKEEKAHPESPLKNGVVLHPLFAAQTALRNACPHIASNIGLIKRIMRTRTTLETQQNKLKFSSVELYLRSNDPHEYESEVKFFLNFLDCQEGKNLAHFFNLTYNPMEIDEDRLMLHNREFEGLCDRVVMVKSAHGILYNTNKPPIVAIRKNDVYRMVRAEQQSSIAKPEERFFYRDRRIVDYLEEECDVRV